MQASQNKQHRKLSEQNKGKPPLSTKPAGKRPAGSPLLESSTVKKKGKGGKETVLGGLQRSPSQMSISSDAGSSDMGLIEGDLSC